jgi:hypothetical protein
VDHRDGQLGVHAPRVEHVLGVDRAKSYIMSRNVSSGPCCFGHGEGITLLGVALPSLTNLKVLSGLAVLYLGTPPDSFVSIWTQVTGVLLTLLHVVGVWCCAWLVGA